MDFYFLFIYYFANYFDKHSNDTMRLCFINNDSLPIQILDNNNELLNTNYIKHRNYF
jgi:hypothetical protein